MDKCDWRQNQNNIRRFRYKSEMTERAKINGTKK